METLRIYATDIVHAWHEDIGYGPKTFIHRANDPGATYFVPSDYYAASMFDRGFITVSFDY